MERRLTCACCGSDAGLWEQWHNRDTGFGLCAACGYRIPRRTPFGRPSEYADPAAMVRDYGIEGVHRPYASEDAGKC